MKWYVKVLKQYGDFKGRARRQEFWMFALFNVIFIFIIAIVGFTIGDLLGAPELFIMFPYFIYLFGVLIPSLAVIVRRLHDQDKSGKYILIYFIPFVGIIWLLVLLCTEGSAGPNQYGPDPKNPSTEINDIGVAEV